MGKKRPQRKIIGKRKKLENVWASKTSLTDTATKRPRNVETIAIISTAGNAAAQATCERSARNKARITGTKAFAIPNKIAPAVLANIRSPTGIGASSKRSKERPFFSNVTVTASKEVVPNRMEIAITPGSSERTLSSPRPDLMKNIPVHAIGKINPQLTFGGLR